MSDRLLTSALAAWLEHLTTEFLHLVDGTAPATVETETDDTANRLYREALEETTLSLPELRPMVLQARTARSQLYAAIRRGEDSVEAAHRLRLALSEIIPHLAGLEAGTEDTQPAQTAPTGPHQEPATEPTATMEESVHDQVPSCLLRRVGKIWHLSYQGEQSDFPVDGNKFMGWLAKLLGKPKHSWTIAELHGDNDGKLAADALLSGENEKDRKALKEIADRLEEIDEITKETGGSETLEKEREKLLRQVARYSSDDRMKTSIEKAYNNVTTQKRQFLKKLKKLMPQLAAHLTACIRPVGKGYTVSYLPPEGAPR
jgi:hypothetical protein